MTRCVCPAAQDSCLCFFRELPDKIVTELLLAGMSTKHLVADIEAVVLIVHRRPFQLSIRQEVEQFAGPGLGADVADIVHPDVPLVAVALIGVRVAPGRVVLLEDADAPAEVTQHGGGRHTAHAGADNDRVITLGKAVGPVAPTDT